jgi:hypothetical protein
MTTIYTKIKQKLEENEHFRERSKRGVGLMRMSLRECGLIEKFDNNVALTLFELLEVAKKYDSYRHEWDSCTRDHINLRGMDYCDGKALSQNKQIEFGYEVGYHDLTK